MFQSSGSLFSAFTLLWCVSYQLSGVWAPRTNEPCSVALRPHFPFRICRVQQVRSASFVQHRGQRQVTLRAALSAVLNRNPQSLSFSGTTDTARAQNQLYSQLFFSVGSFIKRTH